MLQNSSHLKFLAEGSVRFFAALKSSDTSDPHLGLRGAPSASAHLLSYDVIDCGSPQESQVAVHARASIPALGKIGLCNLSEFRGVNSYAAELLIPDISCRWLRSIFCCAPIE